MNRNQKILPTGMILAISCMLPTLVSAQDPKAEPEYDIVIRGGRVLDGAGNPCIFSDVAIKDGLRKDWKNRRNWQDRNRCARPLRLAGLD